MSRFSTLSIKCRQLLPALFYYCQVSLVGMYILLDTLIPRLLTVTEVQSHCISGLQLIRNITSGKLDGDKVGSTSVTLLPSSIGSGVFSADTQTAG